MTERMGLAAAGRQNRQRAALARRAELRPAARRLAAVAVGFAGGWAVLYGALMPFGLGFVLGFAEDCFAPCAAGAARGCAAARVWRALAAQCLYAVRTGCYSGSAVDGCQNTDPGGTGGLRHAGGRGAVLCLWRRRGRAGVLQCGRCPAGRSHGLLSAAVRARKAGCRDASGGCGGSGGAGQCAAVAAAAGRDRLRGAGTVFMQQRAGQSRACGLRGAGRCAVRGRPGPQLCGIRPCLCHGGSGSAGTRTAHGNGSRLRGRLRDRCTLCAAARESRSNIC